VIVVDASAALSALLRRGQVRDELAGQQVHVPHLVDSEITSGLRRRVASGQVGANQAWRILRVWQRLGMTRYPVFALLARVWELRDNVSAYDASYVALAESLGCSLLTADARLARAPGVRCAITVVPH
jgi:predicted nucleic acid-binding protein